MKLESEEQNASTCL